MLRKLKEARAARVEEKNHLANRQILDGLNLEVNRAYAAWNASRLLEADTHVQGVPLKKDEVAYLILDGVGLVEPRRDPGKWVGASQGVSFKVAKGVRYRVGQSRGTFQQGEERPQVIDSGRGIVTNQRMLFVGPKRTTEWAFSKLVGFSLEEDGMAIFNVSNRQKASGFAYQPDVDHIVDAVVAAAIAQYHSSEDRAAVSDELLTIYTEARAAWSAAGGEQPSLGAWGPPRLEAGPETS